MSEDVRALIAGLLLIGLCALAACTTTGAPRPEPEIRTVEVQVPVPQPCPAGERLGAAPVYPDTDAALGAATDIFERVRLLLAGRELRNARLSAVEDALAACR